VHHRDSTEIYTVDVNSTLVEWCLDTRALDDDDRTHAEAVLHDPAPALEELPADARFHEADKALRPSWAA
jgi:hypothetical protein